MSSPFTYTGPRVALNDVFTDWRIVQHAKDRCIEAVQPRSRNDFVYNVSECVFQSLPEYTKAATASHQYVLTLWPAFIGIMVAAGRDPESIAYDNIWWAGLFAQTSGGMQGLSDQPLAHQLEALSYEKAREICEQWRYDPLVPKKKSRGSIYQPHISANLEKFEWACFGLCLALWFSFNVYYVSTLQTSMGDICQTPSFGVAWYWLSSVPAIYCACYRLWQNGIELFEQAEDDKKESIVSPERAAPKPYLGLGLAPSAAIGMTTFSNASSSVIQNDYRLFEQRVYTTGLQTWIRIISNQFHLRPYRILVKEIPTNTFTVFLQIFVPLTRFTIFIWGSITQGSVILMSYPNDVILLLLLMFGTILPRIIGPPFWTSGRRGADLIVFVNSRHESGYSLDT